jgi:hypothetical protein
MGQAEVFDAAARSRDLGGVTVDAENFAGWRH